MSCPAPRPLSPQYGLRRLQSPRQLWVDCVEKVLRAEHADFLRTTGVFDALGRGDHVNLARIARQSSYPSHEGFSCQNSLRLDLCEIFAAASFSTFSTQSVISGRRPVIQPSPLRRPQPQGGRSRSYPKILHALERQLCPRNGWSLITRIYSSIPSPSRRRLTPLDTSLSPVTSASHRIVWCFRSAQKKSCF